MKPRSPQGHFVFSCGPQRYAVEAELAYEVVTIPALTPLPGMPPHVLGIFAHRGEVIPVIDLERLRGGEVPGAVRVVILRAARGPFAVTVTQVMGAADVEGEGEVLGEDGILAHLRGPVRVRGGEVLRLDVNGLFDLLAEAVAPPADERPATMNG